MKRPVFGRERRKGNNLIEFTLLVPWYIFLFAGAFDMGIYSYGLIGVQTAARVGAMVCAASAGTCPDITLACGYALDQLRGLPNIGAGVTACASAPVTVTVAYLAGPDGASAVKVTVSYVAPALSGIPGLLPSRYTASRAITMRLRT